MFCGQTGLLARAYCHYYTFILWELPSLIEGNSRNLLFILLQTEVCSWYVLVFSVAKTRKMQEEVKYEYGFLEEKKRGCKWLNALHQNLPSRFKIDEALFFAQMSYLSGLYK